MKSIMVMKMGSKNLHEIQSVKVKGKVHTSLLMESMKYVLTHVHAYIPGPDNSWENIHNVSKKIISGLLNNVFSLDTLRITKKLIRM